MSEHTHAVNAAVNGLSTLPGTAQPFAATRAMTRFLNHHDLPFHALLEPAQDAVRAALATDPSPVALVVHDWCMFAYHTHTGKRDRYQRSHDTDLGYELASALVVETTHGRPLGPMELRLRTAHGMLSTDTQPTPMPPGHVDELLDVMNRSRGWKLGKIPVHVIDREADSVGHYRAWNQHDQRFLVRADLTRLVRWQEREHTLKEVLARLETSFADVVEADGRAAVIDLREGTGRVRVCETPVVLHRPAKRNTGAKTAGGHKVKIEVPGEPLPLRMVVTRVVDGVGKVLAQWCLFTNVEPALASSATIGRWYAWRWRIETFHKLLKSAGQNAEQWQQETGASIFRRLCVAVMACVTVWHLQREASAEAVRLRQVLVRLSGRQMAHRVESTAPALLAGLEKLLALDDLAQTEDLAEVLALARRLLPQLFRSG